MKWILGFFALVLAILLFAGKHESGERPSNAIELTDKAAQRHRRGDSRRRLQLPKGGIGVRRGNRPLRVGHASVLRPRRHAGSGLR